MASVYLAYDDVLDRYVALKVLSHRFVDDEEFVERFKREAKVGAALSDPNIVSVYDLGETQNGSYYMAMEYVPGGTLRDLLAEKGFLAPGRAVEIALQVAEALSTAHAYGAIHRDIKPQNILLAETGAVKVVDFGIARAAAFSQITRTGHVLGTLCYMSPEQSKGGPVGPQSDLYSLGVVLYEMLTGRLPYQADTASLIAGNILRGHLRPPKEVNPNVPKKVSEITVRLLAQDTRQRYPDASSFMADLVKRGGGESPRRATTQLLGTALQGARTTYKSRTSNKTKPYTPPATPATPKDSRSKLPKRKLRRKAFPRVLLATLILAGALTVPSLASSTMEWLQNEIQPSSKPNDGSVGTAVSPPTTDAPVPAFKQEPEGFSNASSPQGAGNSSSSSPRRSLSQNLPGSLKGSSGSSSLPGAYNSLPNDLSNDTQSLSSNGQDPSCNCSGELSSSGTYTSASQQSQSDSYRGTPNGVEQQARKDLKKMFGQ